MLKFWLIQSQTYLNVIVFHGIILFYILSHSIKYIKLKKSRLETKLKEKQPNLLDIDVTMWTTQWKNVSHHLKILSINL